MLAHNIEWEDTCQYYIFSGDSRRLAHYYSAQTLLTGSGRNVLHFNCFSYLQVPGSKSSDGCHLGVASCGPENEVGVRKNKEFGFKIKLSNDIICEFNKHK